MRIETNHNSTSLYNVSPKFGAIPRAQYTLKNGENVRLFELEKKDLPFIKKFYSNIRQYIRNSVVENDEYRTIMINKSFEIAKDKLELGKVKKDKSHMFIAESKSKLCGILIGGLPKKTPKNNLLYSSRKEAKNNELELNWAVAWNNKPNKHNKGFGKILFSEYFNTLKKDGFKKIFFQSETPEYSYAHELYKSMGFKDLPSGRIDHHKIEYNKDVVPALINLPNYDVIPMFSDRKNLIDYKNKNFKEFKRESLPNKSVNLFDVIK